MKYGIRGHDFGAYAPGALVEKYREKGVETVQLAVPKAIEGIDSYFAVGSRHIDAINRAFEDGGIGIAVLGCYIEPSLEDDGQRKKQVETFKQGIACAKALGAGCIGTETTPFSGDETGRQKAFDRLCLSLDEMLAEAARQGVRVAVEPVAWHTLNSPRLVLRLKERFSGSGLKFIFDPVNLLTMENQKAQPQAWQECIEAFGNDVAAMHIKDARFIDGKQAPCLLGTGVMDYGPIAAWLQNARPDMPLLREEIAWDTAEADLSYMRRVLGGMA